VDAGKSGLARAMLRKVSEDLRHQEEARQEARRHEEEEQRGRYVIEVTALGNRERDIVLATHDGEAAGDAIIALAEALHGANVATIATFLISEAETLENHSRDRGSNLHLVALIALRSRLVALASSDDERGRAHDNLGIALWTLGERENGTARLEQAVVAFRAALEELTRERVPLQWAASFGNQGIALMLIADRNNDAAGAGAALRQIETAYEVLRSAGQEQWSAYFSGATGESQSDPQSAQGPMITQHALDITGQAAASVRHPIGRHRPSPSMDHQPMRRAGPTSRPQQRSAWGPERLRL
jgi:hypothetical protein